MDKLKEIEILYKAYINSTLPNVGNEFLGAVGMILDHSIPARELTLSVKVPYPKNNVQSNR